MSISVRLSVPRDRFVLDVDFNIPNHGISVLSGASGSGKTTILRCIAGLERIKSAEVCVSGDTWQSASNFVPVHRRSVGYVFQNAGLLPHLTVLKNFNYALKRSQAEHKKIEIEQVADWFGLTYLLQHHPQRLSGGEQQRVALARAVLTHPKILLMDEPLSNLDIDSKSEILPYIKNLYQKIATPIIYVTHDIEEANILADRQIFLRNGRIL